MKKHWLWILILCMAMLLCGCVAEVKTVPFEAEDAAVRNFSVVQAYDLKSVFTVENGLLQEQFGFDGDGMLLGTSKEPQTIREKLYAVDAETGVSHQLMQTRFGDVVQVESLQNGEAIVYLVRGSKNGKFTGYRLFLREESDGKPVQIDEWSAVNVSDVILAKKLSNEGSEISYIWWNENTYWLTSVDTETMEKRHYFLGEIIPELIEGEITIKTFYQKNDGEIAGSILLGGKEYYWQAELPDEERSVEEQWANASGLKPGEQILEEELISGEWVIENVRIMEVDPTQSMQVGEQVYYLTAAKELYQMNPKTEEAKRIAKDVKLFCISGDEKTVVYATEKNGALMLYADRIGEYYPALINVSSEIKSLSVNEDGSKVAVSYYAQRDQRMMSYDTAIFDIVYDNAK